MNHHAKTNKELLAELKALRRKTARLKKGAVAGRSRLKKSPQPDAEEFRQLVTGVKDYAIFLLDPNGNVMSWNAGAERIKGYTAEEIIGQHFSRFYPKAVVEAGAPERELEEAKSRGRFEDEGERQRKDGSRFWANIIITALRDKEANLKGFSKITRDLTDRKRAEELLRSSEERFRTFAQSAKDAIIIANSSGRIIFWNEGAQAMFGHAEEEVLGQPLTLLMPESYRDAHVKGLKRYRSTGVAHVIGKSVELRGRRKDGAEFPLELSLSAWETEHRETAHSLRVSVGASRMSP